MVADDTLDPELQLPEHYAYVQELLHCYDPDLRVRVSVERPGFYVLERRCRRAPAINTGMRTYTDMHVQARDGYIHVSLTHEEWLRHPWNIIVALTEEGYDTWAAGGWETVVDELEYEEQWQVETRRRRRRDDGRAYYREMFDILSRMGNWNDRHQSHTERSRWNNPGLPTSAAA